MALVFEWAILQLNQNILRLYLWVHIALLATVFAAARRQYTGRGMWNQEPSNTARQTCWHDE